MTCHRRTERGFTLVEMIVALALLALISLAGLALVGSVARTRSRTEGRLDRLADLQRAMTIVDSDFTQLAPGPVILDAGGLGFSRNGGPIGARQVRYLLRGGAIERIVDGRPQRLLTDVAGVRPSFYAAGSGWLPSWPPRPDLRDTWPAAIALDVTLRPRAGWPSGSIRRVVVLPARP